VEASPPDDARALPARVVWLWRLQALTGVAWTLPLYAGALEIARREADTAIVAGVAATALGLQLTWCALRPAFRHATFRWALREYELRVSQGWVFHESTSVPHARIQHVDVSQGPLERAFGVQTLRVHTAAGATYGASIPGLPPEDAATLREALLAHAHRAARASDQDPDGA
jgi:hypothetical protein